MFNSIRGLCSTKDSERGTGHLSPPTNNVHDLKYLFVIMENFYPCSFKCLKSVAVMVCVWLPLFLFFIFLLQCCLISSLFFSFSGSFSSILLTVLIFSQHRIFNTFSQKDVLFTVFGFLEYFFNFPIVVLPTKLSPVVVC